MRSYRATLEVIFELEDDDDAEDFVDFLLGDQQLEHIMIEELD